MQVALTNRPIRAEIGAGATVLSSILSRIASIRGRATRWGVENDVTLAEYLVGQSVEGDFAAGYYREGFVEASAPTFLPGWSVSRTGAGTAWNARGELEPFASGAVRITDLGLLVEPAATNLCETYNANPTDTTGVTGVTVVDDTADLAASGLSGVCTSGKAFQLVGGGGGALAFVSGMIGSTATGTYSVYIRGGTGYISSGYVSQVFSAATRYTRVTVSGGGHADGQLIIVANAGQTIRFVLMQVEVGPVATTPIVTTGAAATRGTEIVTADIPGETAGTLLVEFVVPKATGATQCVIGGPTSNLHLFLESGGLKSYQSSAPALLAGPTLIEGVVARAAVTWAPGSRSLTADGAAPLSDTTGFPSRPSIVFGAYGAGSAALGGLIRSFVSFAVEVSPERLTDMTEGA
jgi:hypothetical protein